MIHTYFLKGITGTGTDVIAIQFEKNNEKAIFKNFECISKINDTQKDNAKNIDVVMAMYNLIEYDNCSKTSGSLWQYYKDVPNDDNITNSESFKSKAKIIGTTPADGNTKNAEIVVPL